ncbi:hypothetical protein EV175_001578 [Coemansia sp. RSA 1933]|nr:hypothetical protein EV175_001578 [Coemansia sp. RSA 1933]
MAQMHANSMQSPATPVRQLGATRGQRRTPASRTKKPYTRPSVAKSESQKTSYESDSNSGFLKGMRSLIQRFWGTSLKSSAREPDSAFAQNAHPKSRTIAESTASEAPIRQSDRGAFATISPASAVSATEEAVPDVSRRAATVVGRSRSRRPTAESLFEPSPFAYNKRLVTATPSVANLRDVVRVKEQQMPVLSRRHSIGRLDSQQQQQRPRLTAGTYSSVSYMGLPYAGGSTMPTRHISSTDARRLLNTINLINTPITEARTRFTVSHRGTLGDSAHEQPGDGAATIAYGSSPLPFRRLPLSLLALSDTPEKAPRGPMGDASSVLDKETLRRSNSAKNTPRLKNKAPSLARTIQLQQARKAVAERLMRSSMVSSESEAVSEAEYYAEVETATPQEDKMECEPLNAGAVHGRDEDEESGPRKRRHMENGEAMDTSVDKEAAEVEEHKPKRRAAAKRAPRGRRVVSFGRSTSAASESVRWRFSARFEPVADDGRDSSSESDDDREAIASKVPVSKIRGGELIGLSLRPTMSSASASSIPAAPTVRSTGFGGTRTPIPIDGEAEKASKPAEAAAGPKPAVGFTPQSTAAPVAAVAPVVVASAASGPGLAGSKLFGDLAKEPQKTNDSKPESEGKEAAKPATGFVPSSTAATSEPPKATFSFGKPAESSSEAKTSLASTSEPETVPSAVFSFGAKADSTSEAKTVPSAMFSFGRKPEESATPEESSKGAETPSKPAVAFSFGTKAKEGSDKPAIFGEKTAAATFGEKPAAATDVASADTSKPSATLPKFSFTLGANTAKEDSSTPAAKEPAPAFSFKGASTPGSSGGFSFGLKAVSKTEAESTTAAPASESTPKPVFSFGLGGSASAEKKDEAKDKQPAFSIFGGGSGKDESAAKDTSASSGLGFGSTPIFGSVSRPEATAKRGADDIAKDGAESGSKSAAFGFKAPGVASSGAGFTFGAHSSAAPAPAPAPAASTTTSMPSFSALAPAKTVDLTASTNAPTATASSASTPSMFSGFGKPAAAPVTSAGESAMDDDMKEEAPSGFGGFTAKPAFGGFGKPPPAFGSLGQQSAAPSSTEQGAAKKFAFSFGSANTPSAASFEATNVPTPAVTSFGTGAASSAAAAPVQQSFGAPAATPSAFNFGAASSPAATPSATPATSAFSFGAVNTSQPPSMTKPPQSSMFGAAPNNAFGSASTQAIAGGSTPSGGFSGGFGSASASATAPSSGFGSSTALGFGAGMNSGGARVPSNASGFGGASSTGGFNFSSNVSTSTPGFGSSGGGFGSSSGFGAASNASTFGAGAAPSTGGSGAPQFTFGQNTGASTGSFQFNSGGSHAFDGNSSVANSTPATPFGFASNTSLQGGGGGGSFQFTSGISQQSNSGVVGGGGMTLGRVGGGSNASTSSHGRQIAQPRSRRRR